MLLVEAGSKLPYRYQSGRTVIFLKRAAISTVQSELLARIKKITAAKGVGVLKSGTGYFIKTTPIKKISARIRVTLNLARKDKGYDYPLADLKNSLDIQTTDIPSPELLGYGYEKKFGLVTKVALIHEYLDGYVDGLQWLQDNPAGVVELVERSSALILEMHGVNRYHLDLWLGNIMLACDGSCKIKVIDFEHYISGDSANTDELLGFIFGYFYRIELKAFIAELTYDQLIERSINSLSGINHKLFWSAYQVSKRNKVSRAFRRQLFSGERSFEAI